MRAINQKMEKYEYHQSKNRGFRKDCTTKPCFDIKASGLPYYK